MPVSPAYVPDPRFGALGPEFADPVQPADFPQQVLRFRNDRAAGTVGLDTLTDEEWLAHFARFQSLPGNQPQPLAMRYHGHQFRVYNSQLGDGRGFLFAQLRERETGRLLDLGTKGSGQTPWSRTADGRLTLKGGVREVLATEMLEALGVPTSRSFSLVETGEALYRGDEPSPTRSAVLTRLSYSNVRFGTFQRHAYHDRADLLTALVGHVADLYYPEVAAVADAERPAALLDAVCGRSAMLVARWMTAGFVHGVLNTDNMNINGESFDYGPYRFLPRNDPNYTAAYFDEAGLYAFGRQPEAVFWNLTQLAGTLTLLTDEASLRDVLNRFGDRYHAALRAGMLMRLGLRPKDNEADLALVQAAFRAMAEGGEALRWEPFFFDWFCGREDRALKGPRAAAYDGAEAVAFRRLLAEYEPERPERLDHPYFARPEPEELLYEQIEALWSSIAAEDDWSAFEDKLVAIGVAREAWAYRP